MAGDKSYRLQSVTKKKNTSSKMKLKKKKKRVEKKQCTILTQSISK